MKRKKEKFSSEDKEAFCDELVREMNKAHEDDVAQSARPPLPAVEIQSSAWSGQGRSCATHMQSASSG